MLASLGPILFDLRNDLQSMRLEEQSSFAKHGLLGAGNAYEDTGDEDNTIELTGTLHPYLFAGGLLGLEAIRVARAQKLPLPLMRGDFTPLGWFVIESISRTHNDLHARDGVGTEIEYSIRLLRVDTPVGSSIGSILRIFM